MCGSLAVCVRRSRIVRDFDKRCEGVLKSPEK